MTIPKLTEEERARVRYHLGYLNVEPVSAMTLGYPAAQQAGFLVENSMDRILVAAVPKLRQCLCALDSIECQQAEAPGRLKAMAAGEVTLRTGNDRTEGDILVDEYHRWAQKLADMLGVELNKFSERFRGGGMSVPVAPPF